MSFFLALALLCPYFTAGAGALSIKNPFDGIQPYPCSASALDRQINQLDISLLALKNKDNGRSLENSGLLKLSRETGHAHRPADRFLTGNTAYSCTCLWFVPLLPIPPPYAV